MKSLNQIYSDILERFYNKTKIDVSEISVIDSFILASSDAIAETYKEIESNKNPHIFTKLSGDDLDSMGILVNCPRLPNEQDDSYKYRLINWSYRNEASNIIAIESALLSMTHASSVTYVPLTEGTGTATAYIIPKTYNGDGPNLAIAETKMRLTNVISPGTYVTYHVPKIVPVTLVCYISSDGDMANIESNIKTKIANYINSIAPGSELSIGEINKIGVNEPNVEYFNAVKLYINNIETTALKVLQKIESKFLLNDVIWWTVVK